MFALPRTIEPLLHSLGRGFTRPTFDRFLALFTGFLLAGGRHALTDAQWAVRGLVPGRFSSFHRVFSRARWSLWPMGRTLAGRVLRLVPADQPVLVAMDDTVTRHAGPRIYGRGCHRDAVRSSHAIASVCWGHRWVVLAVLVRLPHVSRPRALPVLYRRARSATILVCSRRSVPGDRRDRSRRRHPHRPRPASRGRAVRPGPCPPQRRKPRPF